MVVLGLWLLATVGLLLLVIMWRIMRCLEWLTMFVKGFGEKFVETSRRTDTNAGS